MEDIAKEMEISRASLYSYFENKEEIFRSLSSSLHEDSLGKAEICLKRAVGQNRRPADLANRICAALMARFSPFQEVVTQSAHGSEIYDENNRLCGDLVVDSQRRFLAMLISAMKTAVRDGEVDLKAAGLTAKLAAELLHLSTVGLKQGSADVAVFEKRLRIFVKVFFSGLR